LHWIGGWGGPRAVLDAVMKRKIRSPRRESNPRTPIVQPESVSYIADKSFLLPWLSITFYITWVSKRISESHKVYDDSSMSSDNWVLVINFSNRAHNSIVHRNNTRTCNTQEPLGYGLDDRGSIPGRAGQGRAGQGLFFSSPPRPDRLWSLSILLFSTYQGLFLQM